MEVYVEVCGCVFVGVWRCVLRCVWRCVPTWRYSEGNVVLLTEACGQDSVRRGVVTEVVGAVDRRRAINTDHQVAVQ